MHADRVITVRYAPGQLVHHGLTGQRGAVLDVDARCGADDRWYRTMAVGQPSREQPWYTVLVDGAETAMYVPEDQLEADSSEEPVQNPAVTQVFSDFRHGRYAVRHAH